MSWLTVFKYGPYVLAALIVAGLCVLLSIERTKADDALAAKAALEVKYDGALDINKQQADTIDRITKQHAIDDELVTMLTTSLDAIRKDTQDNSQALDDLVKKDPDVKAFLDTKLPDSLKQLYGDKGTNPGARTGAPGATR